MSKFAAGDFFGGIGAGAGAVVKAFDDLGGSILGVIPLIGGTLGDVLKFFTGALQSAISAATGFAQNMLPFVQALSPSTVEQFNRQMENLKATIGVAFTGFIGSMSETIKRIGGVLLPVMAELKPIFDSLAVTLRTLLIPVFQIFAALVSSMVGPLTSAMGSLRNVVIEVVKGMVLLAAMIAQLFGLDDFLDALEEALTRTNNAGATAAGQASMSNFEQIARDIAVAAAQASAGAGGGEEDDAPDIMEEILEAIGEIRTEGVDEVLTRIGEMLEAFWNALEAEFTARWAQFQTWTDQRLEPVMIRVMDRVWRIIQVWLERHFPTSTAIIPAAQNIIDNPLAEISNAWDFWRDANTQLFNNFGL
jgi:phage-related protein